MAKTKETTDEGMSDSDRAVAYAAAQASQEPPRGEEMSEDDLDDLDELELVSLQITRDITKTVSDVYRHEVPVMELIHGEANVEELGSKGVMVADFEPRAELDRLMRKYGKNGEPAVLRVYSGNADDLAKAAGVKASKTKSRNRSSEQAMAVDHSNPDTDSSGRIKTPRIVTKAEQAKAKDAKSKSKPAAKSKTKAKSSKR